MNVGDKSQVGELRSGADKNRYGRFSGTNEDGRTPSELQCENEHMVTVRSSAGPYVGTCRIPEGIFPVPQYCCSRSERGNEGSGAVLEGTL